MSAVAENRIVFRGKHAVAYQDVTSDELCIEGAIRAGKTTLCLVRELEVLRANPGMHGLLARWTDEGVYGLVVPLWRSLCERAGVKLVWHSDEKYDELPQGQRMYIRGLKSQDQTLRYSKLRGLTLSRAYLDQAEECPEDVYLELTGRLSQPGYPHQMTISPQSVEQGFWIARRFPEDNSHAPRRRYISVAVHDNAHNLAPGYVERLTDIYPPEHPKHRTLILGQRGMNVVGEPVYKGAFNRQIHEQPCAYDRELPLEEAIDFGKHHPCIVWRQRSSLGQIRYLGGILGQDLYLEDFLPIALQYRAQWFPQPSDVKSCCDPAGATDNSHGVRDNGVAILRRNGFHPRWVPNSNAPDIRLAQVEKHAGYMRRRTPEGEALIVAKDDRWLRIGQNATVHDTFLADGFEAGYVWDEHMVSVANKQTRKPKKDGWYEHGQNCAEYLELNFGNQPIEKPYTPPKPYRPRAAWQ